MMQRVFLLCTALLVFAWGNSQNSQLFTQATEHYNKGEYSKAIENYEQILKGGKHSPELYFNLANCHYKLNHIGPSIYYYEKALLLNPDDGEIKNNLKYAQNMRLDAVEEMPQTEIGKAYTSVVNMFSFDGWAYLSVVLIMLFVLGYLAYYFLRSATQKRIAFVTSIFSLVLGLLTVLLAYLQYQEYKSNNPAIVFAKEVKITSEPNENSETVFILHEGTKVNVLDGLNDWQKIKLADGQTGWVKNQNVKLLKDF
ncbi:tetratricopeptide repeat protein [Flagellimonas meridianipacifica]|uniref:Tetratricopeptide repeat protein n=1 Tax=Flagellimonas meridianipacifica TaxID=1080225 RepID=A0A2T0MGT7_9FLAO|nr:SH3 domain-containing protein [Allomuricauda pacifica]PRX56746.1 tetratricopeptide repeat protein [Allomuricauda pacifica]